MTPKAYSLELAVRNLEAQIRSLEDRLAEIERSFFLKSYVPPGKPRELMIRFADGTVWNPGSGIGLYQYVNGVWVKL